MTTEPWFYEAATELGGLDSDELADGTPLSSHLIRSAAMNANQLVTRDLTLANLAWRYDGSFEGGDDYIQRVACPNIWKRLITPIPIIKPPHMTKATIYIQYHADTASDDITFEAMGNKYLGSPGSGYGVQKNSSTGASLSSVTLGPIPLTDGEVDVIHLFVKGNPTGSLMSTGTYGSPNNSTSISIHEDGWRFTATGETWGERVWKDQIRVEFLINSSGLVLDRKFVAAEVGGSAAEPWQLSSQLDSSTVANADEINMYRTSVLQLTNILIVGSYIV